MDCSSVDGGWRNLDGSNMGWNIKWMILYKGGNSFSLFNVAILNKIYSAFISGFVEDIVFLLINIIHLNWVSSINLVECLIFFVKVLLMCNYNRIWMADTFYLLDCQNARNFMLDLRHFRWINN